jgi:hypothetical protein
VTPTDGDRILAAVDLVARTGATGWDLSYDPDHRPVEWTATATYRGAKQWATSTDPVQAAEDLARLLVDGGQCTHCGRRTTLGPAFSLANCVYRRVGARYVRGCDRG